MARVALLATCSYGALVLALRVSGARSLAKMSGYDLVITIALGSLIATIPLQQAVTLADGLTAIVTYLVLQYLLAWGIRRFRPLRQIAKARPHLVVWDGRLLTDRLGRINVTEAEVHAALRSSGRSSLGGVLAVVLENDGQWSVVPAKDAGQRDALRDLDTPGARNGG